MPSPRQVPQVIPEVQYPAGFEIRRVRSNGEIKWRGRNYFTSELLYGEPLGFELIDEDRAFIYFAQLKIGMIDARSSKIVRLSR